jgi:poly-gamma-glutamate synthesis protein (capsule biosynthesis protein)
MRSAVMAAVVCAIGLTFAGCGGAGAPGPAPGAGGDQTTSRPPTSARATVRLIFGGDVMLGRGVARLAAADPPALLAGIRLEIGSADFAIANLESPLTTRPHDPASGPNALEASPATARLLAAAGFDAMAMANNHAGDAGLATVADTESALREAGLRGIGWGRSTADAFGARVVDVDSVRVALLSVDATGRGPRAAGIWPGVAWWDESRVRAAVRDAGARADLVVVGIHGGGEYIPGTDPYLMRLARLLASWGADVVWGAGPHVVQPIHLIQPTGKARPTVVATSLGNLLFDQNVPGTRRGALLEVMAARDGVRAWRVGMTDQESGPPRFERWRTPRADAAWSAGSWWALAHEMTPVSAPAVPSLREFDGRVVDAAVGDADGDGRPDLVVAFRRPFRSTPENALLPRSTIVDRHGWAAHVGVYRLRDQRPHWAAGTLLRPVGKLAACDGALAVAYTGLDTAAVIATGAWQWGGFGFLTLPDLPGSGIPACADIDGDGRLDPLVLERSVG